MSYAVTNPATGETVKTFDTITDADLEAAIASADDALPHLVAGRRTSAERAALIRRVGELHAERRQELAEIIVREMGKPIEQALGEVDFAATIYEYYADNGRAFLAGRADRAARRRRLGVRPPHRRSACCSASCRGTSRTTRWPASPART